MNDPNPFGPDNPFIANAQQINQLEQIWQTAEKEANDLIAVITSQVVPVAKLAELEPFSPSFVFDWIKAYMLRVASQYPPERRPQFLYMMMCTTLTKLVCAPHTKDTDDILAQLEKGMNSDDR